MIAGVTENTFLLPLCSANRSHERLNVRLLPPGLNSALSSTSQSHNTMIPLVFKVLVFLGVQTFWAFSLFILSICMRVRDQFLL